MVEHKDVVLALIGATVSLAGLLLVFVGFIYSRGESYETRRKDRFRLIAKTGVAPFLVELCCAGFCMAWLSGYTQTYNLCVASFCGGLVLTAIYGVTTLLCYL